jgi:hypothetical protein
MRRVLIVVAALVIVSGCASSTSRAVRSEFEDIPVPRGLALDLDKSTIIESQTVKAAKLFYKGRLEAQSLGTAFRTTLESNGWRHLSSTTSDGQGITQVYDKSGNSLHVQIYECWLTYYTCVQMSAARASLVGPTATQPASAEVVQPAVAQPAVTEPPLSKPR